MDNRQIEKAQVPFCKIRKYKSKLQKWSLCFHVLTMFILNSNTGIFFNFGPYVKVFYVFGTYFKDSYGFWSTVPTSRD